MNAPESSPPSANEERTLVILAHLLPIAVGFLAPLIIWLIKKDQSEYINDQGKEALNFQITILIAYVVAGALAGLGLGYRIVSVVHIVNIIFCIIAAVEVSKNVRYRYPLCIRLIP